MDQLTIQLFGKESKDPRAILKSFKDKNLNADRIRDRGIVNETTGAMVLAKQDGINVVHNETSNIKVNQDKIMQVSPEVNVVTNRHHIQADEIMVNHHKLNPQLIELSDTRVLFDNPRDAIGNLTMDGTVLVKAWEENMGRYVLIRRKIRTPLFSSKVNAPLVPEAMGLSTDYIERLDVNAATLLKEDKIKKDKITAEMLDATGGSSYDQGDYNNYEDSFIQSSGNITEQGGMDINNENKPEEKFEDPITTPTSVTVNHVSKSNSKKRPAKALKLEYITIHSTGNAKSSASQERRWLDNPDNNRDASWHLCIDEHECIEAIPLNEVAWHAGTGNASSIGIEICESGNREKTLERAAKLTGTLLKERGWGIDKLKRHNDWTGKNCPRIFNDDDKWSGWESFKKRVQRYL